MIKEKKLLYMENLKQKSGGESPNGRIQTIRSTTAINE